ncbi:hypothetical protein COBT_003588 [Conglomerata obtusa]
MLSRGMVWLQIFTDSIVESLKLKAEKEAYMQLIALKETLELIFLDKRRGTEK